ncbi:MAG: UDP-2,4-diacetamido-2,4,6-trideoxy-beta-L-altropyranose hydrolase [Alphaproteobacteria bacterium]|nr:UDP-2,4-diacetamido-2,4,6-trideoxy-beta-L-altropyranose hydrolase [Alphaproteobacteria bacterium]
MPRVALFRADASPAIGSGHLRRCLALAAELERDGWECVFAVGAETEATIPELVADGWAVERLLASAREHDDLVARRPGSVDLLVVDHYGRDVTFESKCRGWARRILVLDDLADRPHDADLLLDQTLGRRAESYAGRVPGPCRLLLGSGFALLRPEFAALRQSHAVRRAGPAPANVTVSVGGTDPDNITAMIVEGIAESGLPLRTHIMIGGSTPHLNGLRALCAKHDMSLYVDHPDPAALLADADLAIGAAGTSAWERCCLGVPTLLVVTAENQRDNATALAESGAALLLNGGTPSAEAVAQALRDVCSDRQALARMAAAASRICDGLGARRCVMELDPPLARDGKPVRLRPARSDDGPIMLEWQGKPGARRFAHNPEPPDPKSHFAWLEAKLADPYCVFNVVTHGDAPAGVLRFDRRDDGLSFQVSILIDDARHGLGLGKAALALGRRLLPDVSLWAEVLPGNAASAALFRGAGYVPAAGHWLKSDPLAAAMPHRMSAS